MTDFSEWDIQFFGMRKISKYFTVSAVHKPFKAGIHRSNRNTEIYNNY